MVIKKDSPSINTPFLVRNSCERIPVKSFKEEIRAGNDVKNFIADARVALDVAETDISKILEIALIKTIGPNLDMSEFFSMVLLSNDVYQLKDVISGMSYQDGNYVHDQSWLVIMACLPSLKERVTVMVRLMFPVNFGDNAHDIRFLVLVMTPMEEKITKNAFETGRSFATLFVKSEFRNDLLAASTVQEFLSIVERRRDELVHGNFDSLKSHELTFTKSGCYFAAGIRENIIRRIKFYPSDFVDGLVGKNTIQKTLATILFLYFACILPCIAFGVLVDKATGGLLDARRAIIGQAIGGLFFALFSGQPLVIIATTAPLCLFTKVVFGIARDFNVDFYAMFACVGLWNSLFVILYSLLDVSVLMKWCTRNTEEIFAIFIFFAFTVDSMKDVVANFQNFYPGNGCNSSIVPIQSDAMAASPHISDTFDLMGFPCKPESCILFILLMLGTLWLAMKLYNFNQTPYLSAINRSLLSDYALPIAVLVFSFVGSFLFQAIETERFQFRDGFKFHFASLNSLTPQAIGIGAALGFTLSLLFFMDQNISAALVNTPYNNLKKGSGYHLDLFIVGVLNGFTAMLGLPWMHGILPHSPLHARSLADIEERVEDGCVKQVIVRIRETRITGIVAHILIGLSLYLIPYPLSYIPVPVLDGLFLYCAVASLRGNSFFERFCLFFTEQRSYPPNHYIRRCPQRAVHTFTVTQIIQLAIICAFGFWNYPYVQMAFPVVIALLIPIRHFVIPCFIPKDYLEALDGYH